MGIEINGVAHIFLTSADFERCREFYNRLLPFLGLKPVIDDPRALYCIGGRTAFGLQPAAEEYRDDRFVQQRPGLHHICFRARSCEDVDAVHDLLIEMGATVVHPPEQGPWAPGYYSLLFEDPDGVRLEVNYVPGKGLLSDQAGG